MQPTPAPSDLKPVETPPKTDNLCELKVLRKEFTDKSTIGELYLNGVFFCYTLEDVIREVGVKIPGETAIPSGKYVVILDMSTRFKKIMPHILDVPGFDGIRIHCGNRNSDTLGCLLVGMSKSQDWLSESKVAFDKLFPILQKASKITIEIINQKT